MGNTTSKSRTVSPCIINCKDLELFKSSLACSVSPSSDNKAFSFCVNLITLSAPLILYETTMSWNSLFQRSKRSTFAHCLPLSSPWLLKASSKPLCCSMQWWSHGWTPAQILASVGDWDAGAQRRPDLPSTCLVWNSAGEKSSSHWWAFDVLRLIGPAVSPCRHLKLRHRPTGTDTPRSNIQ